MTTFSTRPWTLPSTTPLSVLMIWSSHSLHGYVLNHLCASTGAKIDDLILTLTFQAWSDCVSFGDFESYRHRFERIAEYFAPRFPEAATLGNQMMKTILEKTTSNK
jgi:hypothetical protein